MTLSIVVPAYNAEEFLPRCLDAINASTRAPDEIIVVDDRSTDRTVEIARERGARVLTMETNSGPGAARNYAAREAKGEILLFVDSDVVVRPDTIERVVRDFDATPPIAAVFGSYDDNPAETSFISQYKNLQHHFVHQQGNTEAATFWAGCGAIRRDVFLEVDGFDLERYPIPSIEDIELGYRVKARGHRILLDKQLQVQHLKRWTFGSLLRTDIFCRAVPWSKLILESKNMIGDLNLKTADRMSSLLVGLLVILLPASFLSRIALAVFGVALLVYLYLNREFYGFYLRHRGLFFTLRVVPVHMLYYLYSAAAFASCWLLHRTRQPGRAR